MKKRNMKKRNRIALALTVLLLVQALAGCSGDGDAAVTTAAPNPKITPDATGQETESPYDANGYLKDNLPNDLKFPEETVTVLYDSRTASPAYYVEDYTGEPVNDAIFERNRAISERLGITLEFIGEPGDNNNREGFTHRVQNSYQAGDQSFDIIATYSRTAGMCAINGYLYDLNALPKSYINLDMPWWPAEMTETMTIGDELYFISGDASTELLTYMNAIFYNSDMIKDLGLTEPTQYVLDGSWTIDKMMEMTTSTYQDLDGSNTPTEDDFYGFGTVYFMVDAFYTGSNLMLVEQDKDETLVISPDYASEKAVDLITKLGGWLTNADCWTVSEKTYKTMFGNGKLLFAQAPIRLAAPYDYSMLSNAEWTYGIVPNPKYDENQENYVTMIGNPFSLFGIMSNVDENRLELMTAMLECWGSEAYRRTTPALFETTMKVKYSKDETMAQMFDILRGTLRFDLGRVFSNDLAYMSEIISKEAVAGNGWASMAKRYETSLKKKLVKIVEALDT